MKENDKASTKSQWSVAVGNANTQIDPSSFSCGNFGFLSVFWNFFFAFSDCFLEILPVNYSQNVNC
jgi:hypothetical protein